MLAAKTAISCALLIIRQPAVMGVALVIVTVGAAFPMPSANTNFTVSSIPILPVNRPRSFSDEAVSV